MLAQVVLAAPFAFGAIALGGLYLSGLAVRRAERRERGDNAQEHRAQ